MLTALSALLFAHKGFSLPPNTIDLSKIKQPHQEGLGRAGFGLVKNSKEAHQQPQKKQLAIVGAKGYKYPTSQKLALANSVKTGATEFPNLMPLRLQTTRGWAG
jgi:hypothetical protein